MLIRLEFQRVAEVLRNTFFEPASTSRPDHFCKEHLDGLRAGEDGDS